jgi:hypothetical protein
VTSSADARPQLIRQGNFLEIKPGWASKFPEFSENFQDVFRTFPGHFPQILEGFLEIS